jgi:hypothetical protein
MIRRFGVYAALFAVALTAAQVSAQVSGIDGVDSHMTMPSFDVRFSTGFNYDLLRPPTNVSFRYPVGYFGLNLPISIGGDLQTIPALSGVMDDLFEDDGQFRRGENFKPNAGASQNPNVTVRVDVPLLSGVGSFAYTQNFFMNFSTAIGGASVIGAFMPIEDKIEESDAVIDLNGYFSLRGALSIPLTVNMGWETMTFGYAYRVADNDNLIFALNLHRHLFFMDVKAKANIDLLGHLNVSANGSMKTPGDAPDINITIIPPTGEDIIDFNSEKCNGSAVGRYRAETWTPSIGVKLWRFSLASRFGINTKAKGSINGQFTVPAIVDLETGELNKEYDDLVNSLSGDNANPKKILDTISAKGMGGLITKDLDSIVYETNESMTWKMPDGHTIAFEVIPNRLSVSYTKLFGEVAMKLEHFSKKKTDIDLDKESIWEDADTINFDFGAKIDHIMMLHLNFPSFFINLGLCGFDIRNGDDDYILGKLYKDNNLDFMRLGKAIMLPVLNGGVTLGTKIQLRIEADLLPLPAVRTGFNYYF